MAAVDPLEPTTLLYGLTPDEVVNACGHCITVTCSNKSTVSGYLYTVDPVSGTVIMRHQNLEKGIVILQHNVQSIKIHNDNRLSQAQLEDLLAADVGAEDIRNDSAAMRQRKQQAIQLLETSRVPINYSDDDQTIHILESAHLHPPYVPTSIRCDNSIIRERISKLVQGMPPWHNIR